jgi:diguanylate cyclase (GGDEF)-like protein
MEALSRWWHQPDHFDWISAYLQARGLTRPMQKLVAAISLSLALFTPVNTLWGPPSLNESLAIALGVAAVLAGLGFAAMWLVRWPTARRSLVFMMTAIVFVVLGSLNQANSMAAMVVCSALTLSAGYLAFFHTAPYMVINSAAAIVVAGVAAVRLALGGDVVLALWVYFLIVEINLAVPLGIQIVVRALGFDLLQSDRDPLTGLLNRRAFEHAVIGVVVAREDPDSFLAVAMVDLDHFKVINDTRGHAAGDATLVAVSRALRESTPETAVICRAGGEEFLVADIVASAVPAELGLRLCRAVGTAPIAVTASVGTASIALSTVTTDDVTEAIHRIVAEADAAMYGAKRRGGNRVHHGGASDRDPPR